MIGVITEHLVEQRSPTGAHPPGGRADDARAQGAATDLADGFVALPGGFGTFDEFAEMLTWNQLGLIAKPVVLLDVDGYWGPFYDLWQRCRDYFFIITNLVGNYSKKSYIFSDSPIQ